MNPQSLPKIVTRTRIPWLSSIALLFFCAFSSARADVYWNNNDGVAPGGDRSWGNSANWIGGSPSAPGAGSAIVNPWNTAENFPIVNTAGNTANEVYINTDARLSVVSGGSLSASSLITGIWGNSGLVSVSGGSLSLSGYLNMGAGGHDGDVDISGGSITAANLSINSNGGARLNLSGTGSFVVTYSEGTLGNIGYWISNSKSITGFGNTNGWWVNVDTNSSAGNVVVTAAGLVDGTTATYSNAMNYVGPTVITNNGTLNLSGGDNRLSTTSSVVVNSGTLNLGGNSQTVTGLTGAGTVTNSAGTLTVNVAGADEFGGLITGAGALTKSGTGSMTLGGANSYTGATTVGAGVLVATHGNALGDTAGGTTVVNGAQLRLKATNSGFTVGGETLTISGTGVDSGGALRNETGANTYQGNITLASDATITVDGTLNLDVAAGDAITASNFSVTFDGSGFNYVYDALSLGTGSVTKAGGGMVILMGSNSYSGGTFLNFGTIRLDHAGAAGSGAITQSNALTTLQINTAGTVANDMSLYNLATLQTVTLAGNKTLNGTTTYDIAAGTTTTEAGALGGAGGLNKTNTGTLVLRASNNYSGATAVAAGTLLIANGNALGSTAAGTVVDSGAQLRLSATNSGFVVGNEALTISGQGVTGGGALRNASGDNSYQGNVTLAANSTIGAGGGSSLTIDTASGNAITAANFNLTFDGAGTNRVNDAVSLGTGGITKLGSGIAILSASNNFTGALAVNEGTLQLGSTAGGAAASVSGITVASGATLLVSQLNQVSDTAAVTLSGGTIRTAAGVSEVFGDLNVGSNSFLEFGSGAAGSVSFGTYAPSALLTINNFNLGSTLVFKSNLSSSITNASFFTFSNGGISGYSWNESASTFTITAIPEPVTLLAAVGLLALMLGSAGPALLGQRTR